MKIALAAFALPFLAACATIQSADQPAEASGGACSNSSLQQFIGQPATAALGAQVMRVSGAKTLQWVASGMMVTMDFRQDRVRVFLEERNRVERLSCG